jgi:hypothetical protein
MFAHTSNDREYSAMPAPYTRFAHGEAATASEPVSVGAGLPSVRAWRQAI